MFGVRLHHQPCPLHQADWAKTSQAEMTHSCVCSCNPDSTRSCRGSCQVNGIFGTLAVINDGCHGQYGARCSRCAQLLCYLWLISICTSAWSLLPAVVQNGQQQHVAILHSLPQTVIFTQSYWQLQLLLLLLLLPLLQCSRVIKAKQLVHSRNSSTEPHFDIKMAAHLLLRYIKNRQTMQTHLTQMLSLAVDANYSHKCWLLLQRGMLFCNDCNSMLLVMIQVVASPMHPMTAATSAGWCCRAACCFRMDRWRFPRAAKAGCTTSLGTARAAPTSPCISLNPASC